MRALGGQPRTQLFPRFRHRKSSGLRICQLSSTEAASRFKREPVQIEDLRNHCHSFISIGFLGHRPLAEPHPKSYEVYRCCTPNASMCPTANGSGRELEKPLNAPPSVAITAPEDVPDAGLRSLDHCRYSLEIRSVFTDIVVLINILKIVFCCHDKCDNRFGKSKKPIS